MRNPTRRNRNIGTGKQGHGQNNRMVIPMLVRGTEIIAFFENLTTYQKIYREIHGTHFLFVIEETKEGEVHPCTVEDLVFLIQNIPIKCFGPLKTVVLRQPKRKEKILSPVWGRLIYSYEFEKNCMPAIVLESIPIGQTWGWKYKGLCVEDQLELERLRHDGHVIVETKRAYQYELTLEAARNTQLYRTFLHEIGHWVHYQQFKDEDREKYHELPSPEKEAFAHRFADKMRKQFFDDGVFPYERMEGQGMNT